MMTGDIISAFTGFFTMLGFGAAAAGVWYAAKQVQLNNNK